MYSVQMDKKIAKERERMKVGIYKERMHDERMQLHIPLVFKFILYFMVLTYT